MAEEERIFSVLGSNTKSNENLSLWNVKIHLYVYVQHIRVEYFSHGSHDGMTLDVQSSARYLLNRLKGR